MNNKITQNPTANPGKHMKLHQMYYIQQSAPSCILNLYNNKAVYISGLKLLDLSRKCHIISLTHSKRKTT